MPTFYGTQGSLPHSQVPTTCPYPEPARSSPHPTPHFLKIHLNIVLPYMPGFPKWSVSLRFPPKKTYICHFPPICATCPTHLITLDLISRTILGENYRSLTSSICSFLHSRYLFPLRPKYSPQHPSLKHPQSMFLPQCEPLSFTPIQNTGKIIVLYILIFKYFDSKLKDKRFCTK